MSDQYWWRRHPDDRGFDEVRLVTDPEGDLGFTLRARLHLRYKTSELSGDEWRVSSAWEHGNDTMGWRLFDGHYTSLETACAALYPGLYGSHPEWHQLCCLRVEWWRKGRKLYEQTYDGESRPLLSVAGHLSWAWIKAGEALLDWPDGAQECFQAGCSEDPVSTYELQTVACGRCGKRDEATFGLGSKERRGARRFCRLHLRRGDCGLEDADSNYDVVQGPGPDDHETPPDQVRVSAFGGVVRLEGPDGS